MDNFYSSFSFVRSLSSSSSSSPPSFARLAFSVAVFVLCHCLRRRRRHRRLCVSSLSLANAKLFQWQQSSPPHQQQQQQQRRQRTQKAASIHTNDLVCRNAVAVCLRRAFLIRFGRKFSPINVRNKFGIFLVFMG